MSEEKVNLGQASTLAAYFKGTFAEILGKHKISVFNRPAEELKKDLKNARSCYTESI
ncbi:MAG: hypothetical protein COZ67_01285 [Chloroflexi bacterium CG_4_8_14_3_um_filter_45_15]|nr:MAG: hypothetical protein COZ67_01285 [Chloroflexi bacterium CG_4_8_14_3_um_filter_45_15]